MDFYILAKTITYLFLSLSSPTTLVFEEPIEYVNAGRNGDFSLHRSNNQKILVIQPLKNVNEASMVVITKNQQFQFKVKIDEFNYHNFVYVYPGGVNKTFVKKIETDSYRILEGDSSVLVQNKEDSPILVNERNIIREDHFSKGVPLFINKKRILN